MGVSKNSVFSPKKMDGENNGSKPYEQMDDLGLKNLKTPIFGFNIHIPTKREVQHP